jgi:hypothetical protein
MAKSITSGSLPAGRGSWKSCHLKNPSRRAGALSQQVNKKLHSFFPAGLRGTCLVFFFYIVSNCFYPIGHPPWAAITSPI